MDINSEQKILKLRPAGWALVVLTITALTLTVYLVVLTRNELAKHTFIGRSEQQIYTISISGQGKVTAKPDIAQVTLGAQTEHRQVATAQSENSRKLNELIAALKEQGIGEDDIQTTHYNIYPRYDYLEGRGQVLRGYFVDQSVTVKIRDLDSVSSVLALVSQTGINQVGGLSFTIDDPEELKQEARIKALENAKAKAESLARAAGVRLGKLVSFTEDFSGPVVPYRSFALDAGIGGGGAPEIEPGSQDVVINVTVTYEVL